MALTDRNSARRRSRSTRRSRCHKVAPIAGSLGRVARNQEIQSGNQRPIMAPG